MADPVKPATAPPPSTAPNPKPAHKSTHSKDGARLAEVHASEARVKELEGQIAQEKKRQEVIHKLEGQDLNGEVGHGEKGWIALDDLGSPTGVAMEELPAAGDWAHLAPVVGYFPQELDTLVTPSGAPITPFMNPMPDPRDPGMEARNKDGYKSDYNVPNREEWQMGKPGTAQPAHPKPAHTS
jgi:hypothetical protein